MKVGFSRVTFERLCGYLVSDSKLRPRIWEKSPSGPRAPKAAFVTRDFSFLAPDPQQLASAELGKYRPTSPMLRDFSEFF
jgi:hypothetical protein